MTTIEVVDTAVKIGLGALIAAAGTFIGIYLKARTAADKERRIRRLDIIERSAQDFEITFQDFLRLYAGYSSYLFPPDEPKDGAGLAAMEQLRKQTWAKLLEKISIEVPTSLNSLHAVDASLLLVGASTSSKCAERFRLAVTDLQSSLVMIGNLEGKPTPSR